MPLTKRGKLLAGVAALFALSVAGPGCQSSQDCKTCVAASSNNGATLPGGTSRVPSYGYGDRSLIKTSFPLFGNRTTQEPQLASAAGTTSCGCQTAVMLKPVPLGTPAGAAQTAAEAGSTWSPVQRVGGEVSPVADNPITPVVTLEKPTASASLVNMQTPLGGPLMPVPPAPVASIVLDDKAADKSGDKKDDADKKDSTLPKPRLLPPGKHAAANGYPDLPAAVITQPVKAPGEFRMHALSAYVVEPPDILLVELEGDILGSRLRGEVLVRPDGTIGVGTFPAIFVAGLTLDQIKLRLAEVILPRADKIKEGLKLTDVLEKLRVDVLRYNSKFYYVITDGGGYGEQVISIPLTGNERVLDAIAKIQGLPAVASKKLIWIARATPNDHRPPMILPVDWCAIAQRGEAATNYQMFPGDRLYVQSDPLIRTDSRLAKFLAPIERVLGATLLGASTYNTIRQGGRSGTGSNTANNGLLR